MSIKPTGHYILVRPQKIEDHDKNYAAAKRAGLVILEQEARKEQIAVSKGIVLSVGNSAYKDMQDGKPWCKEGDFVAYVRHGGMYVQDPETEETLLILSDTDIVALLKKESND